MADRPPASTVVTLGDRDRTLRFDYDAIEWLSDLPAARRGNRSPLELWGAANGMDIPAMALMLTAGFRHEDRDLTIEQTRKLLRQSLRLRRMSYREINERLNAAMNQSEVLGLFQPTDDDDAEAGDGAAADPRAATATPSASPATGTTGGPG